MARRFVTAGKGGANEDQVLLRHLNGMGVTTANARRLFGLGFDHTTRSFQERAFSARPNGWRRPLAWAGKVPPDDPRRWSPNRGGALDGAKAAGGGEMIRVLRPVGQHLLDHALKQKRIQGVKPERIDRFTKG